MNEHGHPVGGHGGGFNLDQILVQCHFHFPKA